MNTGGARQRGFTLIEAIVALVLIASAGMAVFGWINTNIMTLGRVEAVNAEDEATLNVISYMNGVNPMLTPEGETDFGAYRVSWRTEPISAIRDGAAYPFGISLYQIALYRTRVAVNKPGNLPWFDLNLRQVGFKKVRDVARPF